MKATLIIATTILFWVGSTAQAQLRVNGNAEDVRVGPRETATVTWTVPATAPDLFFVISRITDLGLRPDGGCLRGGFEWSGPGDADNPDFGMHPVASGGFDLSLEHLTPGATYYLRACYGVDGTAVGEATNTVILRYRHPPEDPVYALHLSSRIDLYRLPTLSGQWPRARIHWGVHSSSLVLPPELADEEYLINVYVDGNLVQWFRAPVSALASREVDSMGMNIPLFPEDEDHFVTLEINADGRIKDSTEVDNTYTFHVPAIDLHREGPRGTLLELVGQAPVGASTVDVADSGPGWAIIRVHAAHAYSAFDITPDQLPELSIQIDRQGFACQTAGEQPSLKLKDTPDVYAYDFRCVNNSGRIATAMGRPLGVLVNADAFGYQTTTRLGTRFPFFDGWEVTSFPEDLPNLVIEALVVSFGSEPEDGSRCGESPVDIVLVIRNDGETSASETEAKVQWIAHWEDGIEEQHCHQENPHNAEAMERGWWPLMVWRPTVPGLVARQRARLRLQIPAGTKVGPGDEIIVHLDARETMFESDISRTNPKTFSDRGCPSACR